MLVCFNKNVNSWKKVYNIPELVVRTVMAFNFGDLVSIFCLTIPAFTKLSIKVCQQENCLCRRTTTMMKITRLEAADNIFKETITNGLFVYPGASISYILRSVCKILSSLSLFLEDCTRLIINPLLLSRV